MEAAKRPVKRLFVLGKAFSDAPIQKRYRRATATVPFSRN